MRRNRALLFPVILFFFALATTFAQSPDPSNLPSEAEAASLVYFLEAETLAHNVYGELYDSWDLLIFSVIAASENVHAEAVWEKIVKFNLEELVASTPPVLDYLYEEAMLAEDQMEALRAAGLIEETMIQAFEDIHPDVSIQCLEVLYDHLYRGTRNHLRSFVGLYESFGETYEPQVLDPELFEAIVDSSMERGPYRSGPSRRTVGPWFQWNNTNDPTGEPWARFTHENNYRGEGPGNNPDNGPNEPGDCDSCTGGGGGLRGDNGGSDNSGGNGGGNGGSGGHK